MPSAKPTPILFLDLDGTIIKGPEELGHFITGPNEVELYDGVLDKLKEYKARGWRIVVVSNQGGIALGYTTENTVNRIMQEVNRLTANLIDRFQWCVHHPSATVEGDPSATLEASRCFCRKPNTGLLFSAMASLSEQHHGEYYRPFSCLFVGDMDSDRACADNLGCWFEDAKKWRSEPYSGLAVGV